jgi:hypothetical protein
MKPVNRMMNVRDVNLTGDSGRLRRTADAANTEPYITFIAARVLVIPCTTYVHCGLDGEDFAAYPQPPTGYAPRSNHKRSAAVGTLLRPYRKIPARGFRVPRLFRTVLAFSMGYSASLRGKTGKPCVSPEKRDVELIFFHTGPEQC